MTKVEDMGWVPAINMLAYHSYKAGWHQAKQNLTEAEAEDLQAEEIQTELIARVFRDERG